MLAIHVDPEDLRAAVLSAVEDGAWTTADVVASVATDCTADRASIVATLWDLVDDGVVRYDNSLRFAGFRCC